MTRRLVPFLAIAGLTAAVVVPQQERSLLISATQLASQLKDPNLVLLYVGPKDDYDAGHIAGARYVDLQDVAVSPDVDPSLQLPDEAELRGRLEKLGIGNSSRIVVVPGLDWGSPSTRVVWTLQAAGLGSRTQLLEGGSGGWRRANLPTTKDAPAPAKPGKLTLAADRSVVVDHAWIQARLGAPGFRLIDARAPVFYDGPGMEHNGHKMNAGHIPGAKNLPFNTLFNDSMTFVPREQMVKMFAEAGVQPGDTVVAYCHIGQQATMVLFAARLTGHPVKLYDGSFTEWESLKLPIEKSKP